MEKLYKIVLFIINNMEKINKEGIDIVDIIKEPMAHPHYYSRMNINIDFYNEEESKNTEHLCLNVGLSGSPSAWNWYSTENLSIEELATHILNEIQSVQTDYEGQDVRVCILDIEGL